MYLVEQPITRFPGTSVQKSGLPDRGTYCQLDYYLKLLAAKKIGSGAFWATTQIDLQPHCNIW